MDMKKILIMRGGLGNQMFQYAFFLSLKKRGINSQLDVSLFSYVKMHNGFELQDVFSISNDVCLRNGLFGRYFLRFIYKYRPNKLVYCDKPYTYCQDVYKSKQPFLLGDWISPSYFGEISDKVKEAFSFKNVSPRNCNIAREMASVDSVSLHIRRGDYLLLPNYCVCDEKYYESSIALIKENVASPVFYVFSNDPLWCDSFMKQFGVPFKIVDWNQGNDSYQDMYLMTQCKHNVIANSTFSWWGAWLNRNAEKIVVSPRKWFRNSNLNANCADWYQI